MTEPRASDALADAASADLDAPPARRRSGWLPIYAIGLVAFAFVLGFAERNDPASARVVVALGSIAAFLTVVLFGQVVLALRGRRRFEFLEELPSHEALEQEKARILAALKEVEFDHAMGKINEADYRDIRARYEAEAVQVLKAIDAERDRWRRKAEAAASDHLARAGVAPAPAATAGGGMDDAPSPAPRKATPDPGRDAVAGSAPAREDDPPREARRCPECETANEPDARFCKRCGTRVEEAA